MLAEVICSLSDINTHFYPQRMKVTKLHIYLQVCNNNNLMHYFYKIHTKRDTFLKNCIFLFQSGKLRPNMTKIREKWSYQA
jgi:hypothetical protein